MLSRNLHDRRALTEQIHRQKKFAFDLEKDLPWNDPIDFTKYLVPLDKDSILFPEASAEQKLAISQFFGLAINALIAEMEAIMHTLRDLGLKQHLRHYPVNPEMHLLGDLFFEEEDKHSKMFFGYIDKFCEEFGIDRDSMDRLLPKTLGSQILKATIKNAEGGGQVFWWTVALVEEVSLQFYRQLLPYKASLEPIFFQFHHKHMEEESRHHNYAFLILELIRKQPFSTSKLFYRHTDLLYTQFLMTQWVLKETARIFEAKALRKEHPFFEALASALPLLRKNSLPELFKKLFVTSPYISLLLNTRHHAHTCEAARKQSAFSFPFPKPTPHAFN